MRMEDLDRPRTRPGSAGQILDDLRWLGIDWDAGPDREDGLGPYNQSDRDRFYEAALDSLKEAGLVYPCYCSRRDIQAASSAPHGPDASVYPGTCRGRPPGDVTRKTAAWRFRVPPGEYRIEDEVYGEISQDLRQQVGDFVVMRRDGIFAYQLAVVVDDELMEITDVLRGVDLLDSTPRQLALIEALGYRIPRYWHVPLVLDESGRRMAKRDSVNLVSPVITGDDTAAKVIGELAASAGLVEPGSELTARELCDSLTLDKFREILRREAAATRSIP